MKKIALSSSLAFLALSLPAYADKESYENPGLSAYLADKPELPPPPLLEFPFPQGAYVSGTLAVGKVHSIEVMDRNGVRWGEPAVQNHGKQKTRTIGGASIGYLFREAGWFNQIDLQYMNWGSFKTEFSGYVKIDPVLHSRRSFEAPAILNSTIRTQTGLIKLYSTLNIGHNFFPYVFAGIGIYHNGAPSQLYVENCSGLGKNKHCEFTVIDNKNKPNSRHKHRNKNVKQGAAGSIGAGVRFRLSYRLMLDINYSYNYLGKSPDWNFLRDTIRIRGRANPRVFYDATVESLLGGSNIRGQAITLSLMLQPWGYAAEVE